MKALGIDFGTKRVGLALSGPGGVVVPWRVLANRGGDPLLAELVDLVREHGVEAVVVGLPRSLDGSDTETTRQARNFAARLARRTDAPVYLADESLTSFEAEEDLKAAGLGGRRLRQAVDAQAAARMLEAFLALDPAHRERTHA